MLQAEKAYEKVVPVLVKLINPLRAAYISDNKNIFMDILEITRLVK